MPQRSISITSWATGDGVESNKSAFYKGEILFGKLRPYFHKVGIAPIDGVCSTDILVIKPINALWYAFVLCVASSDKFIEYNTNLSSGTKMPRTNWNDMANYKIVLPSSNIAKQFNDLMNPLFQTIVSNIHESRTLAALRDTLLPKLVNGEINTVLDQIVQFV